VPDVEKFVEMISNLTEDNSIRTSILNSLHTGQFNDHYILLAELADLDLSSPTYPGVGHVSDLFKSPYAKTGVVDFEAFIEHYPSFELKLIDEWTKQDVANITPRIPVAYSISGKPNSNSTYNVIKANGSSSLMDSESKPSTGTIYVGPSERIKVIEKSSYFYNDLQNSGCLNDLVLHHEHPDFIYLTNQEHAKAVTCVNFYNADVVIDFRDDFPCEDSDRDANELKDHLATFMLSDRNAFDLAFAGERGLFRRTDIEIIATINVITTEGTPIQIEKAMTFHRNDMRSNVLFGSFDLETATVDLEIITWQTDLYQPTMLYQWIEDDADGNEQMVTTPIPITLPDPSNPDTTISTTVTVENTFSSEDTNLGSSLVEYCDPANGDGTEYNTGVVKFTVNLQGN
jgi:hypothetical protein